MLTDSISPKAYRLLNITTDRMTGLIHKSCALGLERLKRLLEQDSHISYGTYLRSGTATSIQCLDGGMKPYQRANISDMIDKTATASECVGYYFIHPSDEEANTNIYSHYFIAL